MKNKQRSTKQQLTLSILFTSVLLFVNTFGGILAQDSGDPMSGMLRNITWILIAYGNPDTPQVVLPDTEITVIFDGEASAVNGNAGCNAYFGRYEQDSNLITLSTIGSTRMACAENIMEQEQQYLAILQAAEGYTIVDDQLWITAGEEILVFTSRIVLEGTIWTLVEYGSPDSTQVALPNTEITIVFYGEAGGINGSAGCNRYFGGYERNGDLITLSAIGSTMMACAEDVMEQEQQYLTILQAAESYALIDGQLRITAGEEILVFSPQSDASTSALIVITAPQNDTELDANQSIHIAGIGRGLFEGNVVVQILDAEGNTLAGQAIILQGENVGMGEPGTWMIDLSIDVIPGTSGQIIAFSPSPADGSLMASDRVTITFGSD